LRRRATGVPPIFLPDALFRAATARRRDAMAREIPADEVARNWDRNAPLWADQVRRGLDIYRDHWNNPAFLELVGDLAARSVLDAGCGEGYNTRIFARRGARMTGIDLSTRMIELARDEERRAPLGIRYEIASYTSMPVFPDESFDAAVSTMALMDGPDFSGAMREIARVVRAGGMIAYSILHPCFATKGAGWINDDDGRAIKFTAADYFDSTNWVERWKFSSAPQPQEIEPFAVPRFDRKLEDYLNGTIEAGLRLERISEPRCPEAACGIFGEKFGKWRRHIPLYLHVRARKPRG
jgi:SAM-dependent methyltransferase